ncbi:MAG: phosphoribosyl-ATP diphosphatase [Candidatus Accumulibacter sp.]|jgi:histidine triad (HIT) family protein|nr:phosphoribosyl-ATP diphosphatase [Accumulibacter sp.]
MSAHDILNRLSETLASRRNVDPEKSYTARLLAGAPDSILKKIGEESAELIMAVKDKERRRIAAESADLVYHLLALLTSCGMSFDDVAEELALREGISGIDEKRSRTEKQEVDDCVFCRIVKGEIPSRKIYEDEEVYAFHDIHPARPVHLLVIPKRHIASLAAAGETSRAVLGRLLLVANRLATENGSPDGFRLIINTGRIGQQEVPHLHAHIIGGPEPVGPMVSHG